MTWHGWKTRTHIEDEAGAGMGTHAMGPMKTWHLWAPGPYPSRDPDYIMYTTSGVSFYIPPGWWHEVSMPSPPSTRVESEAFSVIVGAQLIGTSLVSSVPTPANIICTCMFSMQSCSICLGILIAKIVANQQTYLFVRAGTHGDGALPTM